MKNKKVKLSAVLLLGIGLTGLQAQEAIPSTGGNASGGGGAASYTVGQIVYTTNTGTGGSATQGVQQPFDIFVVTELEEATGITLQCSAYPNPATYFLKVVQTQGIASQQEIKTFKIIKKYNHEKNNLILSQPEHYSNATSPGFKNTGMYCRLFDRFFNFC